MGRLAGQRAREKEGENERRKEREREREKEREQLDGLRRSVDGRSGVVAASSP